LLFLQNGAHQEQQEAEDYKCHQMPKLDGWMLHVAGLHPQLLAA
jgi:hypothetical protein